MAVEKQNKAINILGYSEQILVILFETLSTNGFQGEVNIIKNDNRERLGCTFEDNIKYNTLMFTDFDLIPKSGFTFCSNLPKTKEFLYNFYHKEWNISHNVYTNIIHKSSIKANTINLNNGVFIGPLAIISAYTNISFGVTISRNVSIGHHCDIEEYCTILPRVTFAANVTVKRNTMIGSGTTIFNGVTIGENTIIGGGSVVTKDIPANCIAYGNPCKVIKENN